MKKNFWMLLSSVILFFCAGAQAQVVQEGELALVYYMPYTNMTVELTVEKEILKAGPFCHFAEEFLGVYEYIEQDEVNYRLKSAEIHTYTAPDYNRPVKIVAENDVPMQLLTLTEKGLLYGFNVPMPEKEPKKPVADRKDKKDDHYPQIAPYTEDHMKTQSLREMAEVTAKQIYRIRENRMYILGCEVEKAPADGKAMKTVLEELDKQERQLVELFIGTRSVKVHHHTYQCAPDKNGETVLARLDKKAGLMNADSEQGEPILLNTQVHKQVLGASTGVVDKKAPKASSLYYNLPGSCIATVSYMGVEKATRNFQVAQLGVSVPLARNLFTGKTLPEILFNTKTGEVKSITK